MTHDCDTFTASSTAAPAEVENDAWFECDDPHYQECADDLYDDETDEPTSWWTWPVVGVAWAAGALAVAVVIGMAYVALTPQQQPPSPPQQHTPATSVPSMNDGTIVPFPPNQPQNT